jgi:transposase-like protein
MRRRYTVEQREQLVKEVRSSGASVMQVAKGLGVSAATAYLWMKAPSTQISQGPKFARLVTTRGASKGVIAVQVGSATLHVEAGFDAELLRAVVSALTDGRTP